MICNLDNQPIIWAVSEITDGNISYLLGDKDKVLESRSRWFSQLSLNPANTVCMQVEHGNKVIIVEEKGAHRSYYEQSQAVRGDALITSSKNLTLFLLTADCLPIVVYDPIRSVIALIHVGWKNLGVHLVPKVITVLTDSFDSKPEDLLVGIGPGIAKESYVQLTPTQLRDREWKDYISSLSSHKYLVDLKGFTYRQLLEQSILSSKIIDLKIDTYSDNRFFSHYRANHQKTTNGRFATIVTMI